MSETLTSQPCRTLADMEAIAPDDSFAELLMHHVYATDESNESYALEWKSTLDLTRPAGIFLIVKNILGFANREPSKAAQLYNGYGYLVVGVEPGRVCGVDEPMDPANLTNKLRQYIGDQGPAWAATWMPYPGTDKSILVVSVGPPQNGDPIHTLKKQFSDGSDGQIYVRRPGQTAPASAIEIQMLEQRLLAGSRRLSGVIVTAIGKPLESVELSSSSEDAWRTKEASDLLQPLQEWEESERRSNDIAAEDLETLDLDAIMTSIESVEDGKEHEPLTSEFASLTSRMRTIKWTTSREERTADEYRSQVEEYLDDCCTVLPAAILSNIEHTGTSCLQLQLENPSERNIKGLAVRIEFSGEVVVAPPDLDDVRLPREPRPWGPRNVRVNSASPLPISALVPPTPLTSWDNLIPGYEVLQSGPAAIEFTPVNLRPHETVGLPEVPMIVMRPTDSRTVAGTWHATSSELDGRLAGNFQVSYQAPISVGAAMERCRRRAL